MTEDSLGVDDSGPETVLGVPFMTGGPSSRSSSPRVVLRSVPALEALPPVASAARASDPAVVLSARVPPPSSKDMSSRGRRVRAQALDLVLFVVTLGVGWLLWSAMVWRHGQSPAKWLLRMRCIDTVAGAAARFGRMAGRELGLKWLPGLLTLGIGWVVGGAAAFGERRETLWDKAAKTIVIDDPTGRYRPRRDPG